MLAPQSFSPQEGWYRAFYEEVAREPSWLYGVSFAPWEQDTIGEMVRRLPRKYRGRIRHYPDITHNLGCQFAMRDWNRAFALIEGRECSNPRPRAMKVIHNDHAPFCMGSITYSEGIHDDVNKFVWGQQDWDSDQTAETTVREYVRLLIDADLEEELTRLVFLLEESWDASVPIAQNECVDHAWLLMNDVDAKASPATRGNWRYQMIKLRALGDCYVSANSFTTTGWRPKRGRRLKRPVPARRPPAGGVRLAGPRPFRALRSGTAQPTAVPCGRHAC
jgi:hypothetical protein